MVMVMAGSGFHGHVDGDGYGWILMVMVMAWFWWSWWWWWLWLDFGHRYGLVQLDLFGIYDNVLISGRHFKAFQHGDFMWGLWLYNRWKTSGRSLHRIPVNKPDLLTKWISAIWWDNWKPKKDMYICSDHFTPDSFLPIKGLGRRKLKPNAVPSIFPKFPQHLQVSPKPKWRSPKKRKIVEHSNSKQDCKGTSVCLSIRVWSK